MLARALAVALLLLPATACAPPPDDRPPRRVTPTARWSGPEADAPSTVPEIPRAEGFWRARSGGEVWSSPACPESGPVLFGSDDGNLYGVDPRDGSVRFKRSMGSPVRRPPRLSGNKVLVLDEGNTLSAFTADSGRARWSQRLDEASAAGWGVSAGRVVHGGSGALVARNSMSGGVLWKRTLDSGEGLRALTVDRKRVYGVTEGGRIDAWSADGGERTWSVDLGLDTPSAPVSYAGHLLLVGNGYLWSLDPRQGHEQWRALTHEFVSASPETAGDPSSPVVLVAGGDTLFAFDLHRGHELWRRDLGAAFRSGPRGFGGSALVGSGEHLLAAYDLESGRERWRFETDAFITGALSSCSHPLHGDRVLFGGVDGALYGVALELPSEPQPASTPPAEIRVGPTFFDGTPEILWRRSLGPTFAPPAPADDLLVFRSAGRITALKVDSGEVLWRRATAKGVKPSLRTDTAAPAVDPGARRVYVADGGRLEALELDSGEERWSAPRQSDRARLRIRGLAVADGRVFVVTSDGEAQAFDGESGARLWLRRLGSPLTGRPAVEDRVVYVAGTGGRLWALQADRGTELWAYDAGAALTGALVDGGTVYVGDGDGTVHALDGTVGGVRWTASVGGSLRLPPATLFGTVFACGDDGRLFAVDALTGIEAWRRAVGSRCTGAPAVHDGIVYAGSQDRSLHAINAVNGEELWRLYSAAPILGITLARAADGRPLVITTDRSGDVLAVGLP